MTVMDEGPEPGRQRAEIVEKLRQAIRESEALSTTIGSVPDKLIWDRVPGDGPSVAELLWLVHLADEFRFRPVVETIIRGLEPRLQHINPNVLLGTDPVPDDDIDQILNQLVESRSRLLELIERVPDTKWNELSLFIDGIQSTFERFVSDIVTHDTEILRTIGLRLHASDISGK